jgi:LysR family nitrogen assimilation transcriptional regulator
VDFKQIAYFVQVAELGSFTRASSVLRVAQPALSRQVRALEVELRQPLFDRNGRGVTLTEAGQRLLAHGRGILQQVERARLDLEDQRGAASGLLSIGLPPSIGRTLTAPLVDAFRERFPKATLTMVEGLSTYTLEWLQQGRIDCAVVYNATPAAAIELRPVLQEGLFLVSARGRARPPSSDRRALPPSSDRRALPPSSDRRARPPSSDRRARPPPEAGPSRRLVGKPVTLAEVAAHELVIPSRPHAIRMRLETALAEAGLKPRVGLEIESVPAILDLVLRHPLHAVLSLNAVRGSEREAAYAARPIATAPGQAPLATSLWIATSAQRPRGPLLEQSVALVAELLHRRLTPAG